MTTQEMQTANNVSALPPRKSLLVSMAGKYNMDPETFKNTIKATVMPNGATNEQMAAFLLVADQYDLNPVTKEIYAFPSRGGGVTPVVGIDGWINLAQRRGEFDGMEFDYGMSDRGELESCTCRVFRKDRNRPIVVTEYMDECRRPTDPWKSHPRRMLRHKAAIQAIRYAFGFSGIKDEDDAEVIYANATVVENEPSQASAAIMDKARKLSASQPSEPDQSANDHGETQPDENSPEWPKRDEAGVWRDSRGLSFDGDIHGVSVGGVPATTKSGGEFCKKRGCDPRLHAERERQQMEAMAAAQSSAEGEETDPNQGPSSETGQAQDASQPAPGDDADPSSGPSFGYPEINTAIARAATLDACDLATDMLRSFTGPDDQREELQGLLDNRRSRIEQLTGGEQT